MPPKHTVGAGPAPATPDGPGAGIGVRGVGPGVVSGLAVPRPLTLREHAIQTIRQAIVSGALPPGERIRQAHLAQQLGISRGPVREAIRALEQEGLVRTEPYRASYVTSLSEEELEHLYRVRAEVEVIAARRLAGAIAAEPARLAPYAALLEEMRGAAAEGALARLSGRISASTSSCSTIPDTPSCRGCGPPWTTSCAPARPPSWRPPRMRRWWSTPPSPTPPLWKPSKGETRSGRRRPFAATS